MTSVTQLSDCIEIRQRFMRSVHLERDCRTNVQNGDYIITPTSRQILHRVAEGLNVASTCRAWTITGPYGVGKSAFAVFLTRLLCQEAAARKTALKHLESADKSLATDLSRKMGDGKGMLPIAITARRAPTILCLTEGIRASLSHTHVRHVKPLVSECDALLRDARKGLFTDNRRVVALTAGLTDVARTSGFSGLLFMIDELGKLFEFAARTPQMADVFVLQELAEQASRSGAFPSLFLGFLHQSFEEYGQHVDGLIRKEWAKIHGRFEDIAFLEPPDQVARMVAAAMKWTGRSHSTTLTKQIRQVAKVAAANGVCPPGMKEREFEDVCFDAYPLHPITLAALPFIFRRFAQNERSLFSYLSSLEPSGFQDFLRTHSVTDGTPNFLRLHQLFDYFTVNFGSGLFRQPQARRWLEAADVLDRKEDLTLEHNELIKTIGVLGAIGEFSHLSSTQSLIAISLYDTAKMPSGPGSLLHSLQAQSVLTYRRFNKTYRIWEGSDVDIDEQVAEGMRQLRGQISLASGIQQYLPPRPIVARKHSFLTGSLRYFSVTYLDDPAKIPSNPSPDIGAAGQVLVCLSSSAGALQDFRDRATSISREQQSIVFAVPQQIGEMQSAVIELAALKWVSENTLGLRDDRVARREIALRIAEAEYFLRHTVGTLLDPRKEPLGSECLWYWNGKQLPVGSRTDVSRELSTICDRVYAKTPWIRNELIARRTLSSAAAAARRNLIEKMLASPSLPALGIESYPPERSMYESVLKATGLHSEAGKGTWRFTDPPEAKHHGLAAVWDRLREIVFESKGDPTSVDTVFRLLADAPYGVMDGVGPVLLCAFMQAHSDEVTLYREGTFIPEPTIADFEVMMRRPELFAVAGCRISGVRGAVVERLAEGLKTRPATVPIVRAMFRMVKSLPEFAWRTNRLPAETIELRTAFEKAKSPEKFLYSDLPVALGLPPLPEDKLQQSAVEEFFDKLNGALRRWSSIAPEVYSKAKAMLLTACGLESTDAGWQQLRGIAAKLEPRESDPILLQFLRRVIQSNCDESGIDSILALVANRPLASWLDSDVDRFPQLANALGESIKRAMDRADIRGEPHHVLDTLTPDQREKAKSLALEFERKINVSLKRVAPEVLRTALSLLTAKLCEGAIEKK